MARYDSGVVWDDGTIYDANLGVLTADEDAVAGQTPALPDRLVPWRVACAEIWTFDPITWEPVDKLEHVSDNAQRQISLTDLGRQTETLTFDLFPPLAADLLEGDWLCVQWTVASPTQSTTYLGGVFRITDEPNIDRDASGILYHVAAVDWWSYLAATELSPSGWYLATLLPGDTKPEQLVNFLGRYAAGGEAGLGAPFHYVPWDDFGVDNSAPDTGPYTQITSPGTAARISDLLAWFWPRTGGYTLAYHADGGFRLSGKTPAESGLYLTDDTLVLGTVPPPWETVQRTYQRPDVLTVQYWLNNTDGANIYFREASAATNHDFALATIERVVDTNSQAVTLAGFPDGTDFCRWRLQMHLGAADTLAITLDSAFPPPPMGTTIAVRVLPTGASTNAIAGHYRITGWSQPVGVGAATATCQWWAAL